MDMARVAFATFSKRGNIFSLRKIGNVLKTSDVSRFEGALIIGHRLGFDSREIETGLHDNETRFISREERERK